MGEPKKVHPLVSVPSPLTPEMITEREVQSIELMRDCVAFRGPATRSDYAQKADAHAEAAVNCASAANGLSGPTKLTMIFIAGRHALQSKIYAAAAADDPTGRVIRALDGLQ